MAKYLNDDIEKVNYDIKRHKETINELEANNKNLMLEGITIIANL
jgi:hypothetical protein